MLQPLLHRFFSRLKGPGFTVVYWNGATARYGDGAEAFRLILRKAPAAGRLLVAPELAFGEGYMDGDIEVEGDLEALLRLAGENGAALDYHPLIRWWRRLSLRLPEPVWRQWRQVQHHYDIGNDFFRLWLDPTMTYSCAYFHSPGDSLHQAQLQKIDHVLRKLHLQPGERLLDIGCGWGWLVLRAARQYGVKAVGITLSKEQCTAARERIAGLGLTGQVEIRLQHYADLAGSGEQFDKVASVGMFEHVGNARIPAFMRALGRLVRPGGLCLLHTITRPLEAPVNAWTRRYIFPGGYIPSWRQVVWALADRNLRLLDAEDLRPHYAMTLDHWADAFDRCEAQVRQQYGERFVRMWRLYLRAAAAAFRSGGLHIHQFLVSHGVAPDHPLTRAFLYASPAPPPGTSAPAGPAATTPAPPAPPDTALPARG